MGQETGQHRRKRRMIFDEQRAFELSQTYVAQRLAGADRERLLLEAAVPRPALTTRLGGTLIRAGRRLESWGGVPQPSRPLKPSGYSL
jgi:hypothetical protein